MYFSYTTHNYSIYNLKWIHKQRGDKKLIPQIFYLRCLIIFGSFCSLGGEQEPLFNLKRKALLKSITDNKNFSTSESSFRVFGSRQKCLIVFAGRKRSRNKLGCCYLMKHLKPEEKFGSIWINCAGSKAQIQLLIDAGENNGWNGTETTSNQNKFYSAWNLLRKSLESYSVIHKVSL